MRPVKSIRCAIYTRVSTDQGLEQEFNSLDAQREASEAFIKSQAHEGWICLKGQYDDGGYSGGSLEEWLQKAKPGYKIYIQFYNSVVINYQWDAFKQQWNTMLYKNKPFAAGTIEIK